MRYSISENFGHFNLQSTLLMNGEHDQETGQHKRGGMDQETDHKPGRRPLDYSLCIFVFFSIVYALKQVVNRW